VAARRLVVVMLVLLAISTLAAALLPTPHRDQQTTAAPAARTPKKGARERPPSPRKAGLLLVSRMQISARPPKTVRIERGDELRLEVAAPFGADIEIPAFGLTSAATRFAPAQFDLFADRIGTFDVRAAESGRLAGRLLVGRPDSGRCGVSTPATPEGRASTRACPHRGRRASPVRGRSAPQPSAVAGRRRR
jgi:hypothetical protein